ncbi:hypothetical protein J6590_016981 [Homalodisca vitripennis]|nr:hypothetical protein J6590_016981 [Homalodisca vitripennis]
MLNQQCRPNVVPFTRPQWPRAPVTMLVGVGRSGGGRPDFRDRGWVRADRREALSANGFQQLAANDGWEEAKQTDRWTVGGTLPIWEKKDITGAALTDPGQGRH